MMVSMGIYGDVIGAVTGMPKHFWKSVKFLLPYAIGMLIGIGGLSFAIGYFFLEFPFETAMLFIGLIFGGVPLLLPKIMGKRITFSETLLFVLFFGLVVWMQFWKQGTDAVSYTHLVSLCRVVLGVTIGKLHQAGTVLFRCPKIRKSKYA